jgi:hypothetical protein
MSTPTEFSTQVILRLNGTALEIDKEEIVRKTWWFVDGMWQPKQFPAVKGNSWITLNNIPLNNDSSGNLFIIRATGEVEPLFAIDRGFVVQKDISAGGFVSSNQGELWLGSGRDDQVDMPKIILTNAGVSRLGGGGMYGALPVPSGTQFPVEMKNGKLAVLTVAWSGNPANTLYRCNGSTWIPKGPASNYAGYFDTLYLRKLVKVGPDWTNEVPGNLDLGDLMVHGLAYVKMGGQAGGQLRIENTNASGGVLSIGVGDSGMYPYRAWIGCPYGTNSINDFAYGMFLGFPGQSAIILAAKWANADRMVLDQTGNLNLPSYNAGIEVGHATNGGTPYIDFHYGKGVSQDFNVRLINNADGWLRLEGHFNVGGDVKLEHSGPVYLNVNSTNNNAATINLARGGNSQMMFGVSAQGIATINASTNIPLTISSGTDTLTLTNKVVIDHNDASIQFGPYNNLVLYRYNNSNSLALTGKLIMGSNTLQFNNTTITLYGETSTGLPFLTTDANLATRQRLGIGVFNTSAYSGPLYHDQIGVLSYNQSSERYKENIKTAVDCSWVYNLRPVTFDWKDPERAKVEGSQLGLIAEEVHQHYPQLTWLDKDGKPEGVHYEWLGVSLLVELKKLRREVDELKTKLAGEEVSTKKAMRND